MRSLIQGQNKHHHSSEKHVYTIVFTGRALLTNEQELVCEENNITLWSENYNNFTFLSELLHLNSPSRSLRSAVDTRIFHVPRMGRRTLGERSFQ